MITNVPKDVRKRVAELLDIPESSIRDFTPCAGGCINSGGKLVTDRDTYFLKWNNANAYPGMFEAEFHGLHELFEAGEVRIPKPVLTGIGEKNAFILMEFIENAPRSPGYWEDMGRGLAALHKHTSRQFGLEIDNYIGSLPQSNKNSTKWVSFFTEERLLPQFKMAVDSGRMHRDTIPVMDNLIAQLGDLLPEESPALLHGDLWGGNVIVDERGKTCLIDPAVYYGHREADLSFTRLFGGFDEQFYRAYNNAFPLESGFENRVNIYNLYPLLVHVNIFGGGYVQQVKSILSLFN